MRPEKEKVLDSDSGDPEWSERICKIDPANIDGRYHKCIGPQCGHWSTYLKMCGLAAIGEVVRAIDRGIFNKEVHTLDVPDESEKEEEDEE